mmetsp:Transcript_34366/g.74198  ORF Transcript_34366/g.74198 Transcript_34366/m.74198 type:complete len:323 (+) Transcript_34366:2-970(+)
MNAAAMEAQQAAMVPCPRCGRTFSDHDRMSKHLVGCKAAGAKQATATLSETKAIFELWDLDGSGAIDVNELISALGALGHNRQHCLKLFSQYDCNQDGQISFEEFLSLAQDQGLVAQQPRPSSRSGKKLPPMDSSSSDSPRMPAPLPSANTSLNASLNTPSPPAMARPTGGNGRPTAHFVDKYSPCVETLALIASTSAPPPPAGEQPSEFAEQEPLIPCEALPGFCRASHADQICGRKFGNTALQRHSKICQKVFNSKRPKFNTRAQRLDPEAAKLLRRQKPEPKKPAGGGAVPKWKKEHNDFQEALKAGREYSQQQAQRGR